MTKLGVATAEHLHGELIDTLSRSGVLPPEWEKAFRAVPRHEFVPDTVWREDDDGALRALHRADEPDLWLNLAYADAPVYTQVDDGHPPTDGAGHEVTSSTSMPTIVAQMLTALELRPGMRVLEIGTGTGWNAALLAQRVGAANVVSVEIDPAVADQARSALDRAGYRDVTVVTGDGQQGVPDLGPYDRVIAAVGARTVPYPWVAQTGPGGRLVVPLAHSLQPPGIAALDVCADGIAQGRLGARAAFMGLRAQRIPRPRGFHFGRPADHVGTTDLHPWYWAEDRGAMTAIGQRIGDGVHTIYRETTGGAGVKWLSDPHSRSWAAVDIPADGRGPYPVEQAGPRKLLDEVMVAYRWWVDIGSPPVSAWTVTVGPAGQTIAVDAARAERGSGTHGEFARP